jgi:hypothetical protein
MYGLEQTHAGYQNSLVKIGYWWELCPMYKNNQPIMTHQLVFRRYCTMFNKLYKDP